MTEQLLADDLLPCCYGRFLYCDSQPIGTLSMGDTAALLGILLLNHE